MKMKCLESNEKNVWKYVFEDNEIIYESVLYRYNSFKKRTVICCSVQSGCPVGCVFCGTGKKFIRNLTHDEIIDQIRHIIKDKNIKTDECEKFQIMFMSMGEPFLNYDNVQSAIIGLNQMYPNAQLLVSTVAPTNGILANFERFIQLSKNINKVGLQFSLHHPNDSIRKDLIPYNILNVRQIRDFGITWWVNTRRPVYLNYCVMGNETESMMSKLADLYPPHIFHLTFSVICNKNQTIKSQKLKTQVKMDYITGYFMNLGYNVRQFDPAGQDDIGGGCGQLWHVQKFFKEVDK
jgi:23S rRNA (adenine2503-C2)-methyltransferase